MNNNWESAFWSKNYCIVSTSSATIETIKDYIENQGKN
ncbi:MAG: transposase [Halanaerobiales bacterium]|nr:transposase [Halanaerobiales bacterium]